MRACCLGLSLLFCFPLAASAKVKRIDLVASANVVRFDEDLPGRLKATPLDRGADGYDAWIGPDGQYMIGVEWATPRELTEVNIEFRHAIANREEIKVQYWVESESASSNSKLETGNSKLPPGRWQTAKADWWAGDRDVTFRFVSLGEEQPAATPKDQTFRKTRRLRYLLGKAQLPPVRYLRAYGPGKVAESDFEILFDANSKLKPPVDVTVVNGHIMEEEPEHDPTTTQDTRLEPGVKKVTVRYFADLVEGVNVTHVHIASGSNPKLKSSFMPAAVRRDGSVKLPDIESSVRSSP